MLVFLRDTLTTVIWCADLLKGGLQTVYTIAPDAPIKTITSVTQFGQVVINLTAIDLTSSGNTPRQAFRTMELALLVTRTCCWSRPTSRRERQIKVINAGRMALADEKSRQKRNGTSRAVAAGEVLSYFRIHQKRERRNGTKRKQTYSHMRSRITSFFESEQVIGNMSADGMDTRG